MLVMLLLFLKSTPSISFFFFFFFFFLLLFSHPVVSDLATPWTAARQPPCLSLSPRVYPSSCSLHQWCCPAISSSDALLSFCSQSFPASGTSLMSHLFASDDQNTTASASVLPVNIQSWSPLILTDLLAVQGAFRSISSTTVRRHQFFGICLLYGPALRTVREHWEDHNLDYTDLCWQTNVSAFQHTV